MDEVRSPRLGVRPSAADRIGAAAAGAPGRNPAIDPTIVNLAVVGAVLAVVIGITFYIWHDVGGHLPEAGVPEAGQPAVQPSVASPELEEIERLLGELSFTPGPIDGIMDAETAASIRAFQQAAGLPEDGLASPEILEELKAVAGQPN
jgi:hypothetical protein